MNYIPSPTPPSLLWNNLMCPLTLIELQILQQQRPMHRIQRQQNWRISSYGRGWRVICIVTFILRSTIFDDVNVAFAVATVVVAVVVVDDVALWIHAIEDEDGRRRTGKKKSTTRNKSWETGIISYCKFFFRIYWGDDGGVALSREKRVLFHPVVGNMHFVVIIARLRRQSFDTPFTWWHPCNVASR